MPGPGAQQRTGNAMLYPLLRLRNLLLLRTQRVSDSRLPQTSARGRVGSEEVYQLLATAKLVGRHQDLQVGVEERGAIAPLCFKPSERQT